MLAVVALFFVLSFKLRHWLTVERRDGEHTMGEATGLGYLGPVRQIAPPHTSENYVMKEMGYRVARLHAAKLKGISVLLACVVPAVAAAIAAYAGGAVAIGASIVAVAACAVGVLVERWLFFAEARHVVILYYGEASV